MLQMRSLGHETSGLSREAPSGKVKVKTHGVT